MIQALYRWPAAAAFGRVVPKSKFYEHGDVRSTLRESFVKDVQRITWAYKLADSTINLTGTVSVPEIQVFTVETKNEDVGDSVLSAVDRSVHFPVFFEVLRGASGDTRMAAAPKTLGKGKPALGPYLSTGWISTDSPRAPLPVALDLPSMYEALLTSLLPLAPRQSETVSQAVVRMEMVRKLEREIVGFERKLRTEPQLNRKIKLRRELKDRQGLLASLL